MNIALLAALPILAAAPVLPKPVSLGIYRHCATSKYGANCDPTLQLAKGAARVSAFTAFPACSPVPLRHAPSAPIRHARFRFNGTVRNVVGKKVAVSLTGHVLTRRSIRVTYRMSTNTCRGNSHTVTLKFAKVGRPGEIG